MICADFEQTVRVESRQARLLFVWGARKRSAAQGSTRRRQRDAIEPHDHRVLSPWHHLGSAAASAYGTFQARRVLHRHPCEGLHMRCPILAPDDELRAGALQPVHRRPRRTFDQLQRALRCAAGCGWRPHASAGDATRAANGTRASRRRSRCLRQSHRRQQPPPPTQPHQASAKILSVKSRTLKRRRAVQGRPVFNNAQRCLATAWDSIQQERRPLTGGWRWPGRSPWCCRCHPDRR